MTAGPEIVLPRDDLAVLTAGDIAAQVWRRDWMATAFAQGRGGRQIPPYDGWNQTIFRCGRGWGKTVSEVNWLGWEMWRIPNLIGHAVAPTLSDVKGTLFEGPAGFLATIPNECLLNGSVEQAYNKSDHILRLSNGSMLRGFGATDAGGRLRGPQCHAAIGDELREWDKPAGNLEFVHSNMMFGVRLPYPDGTPARAVMGTTPKPIPYLKRLYRQKNVLVVTGTTYENLANLSGSFRDQILAFEGTQMGRVEIYGEDVDDEEGALFKRSWFRLWPTFTAEGEVRKLPEFQFVLMSLDTAMSDENYDPGRRDPDYTACGVYGIFNVKQCFTEQERKRMGVRSQYAALLCDFWMERLGFPELLEKAREDFRKKWGSPGRRPDVVLIENKQSGISLRQSLMQYGVPTWPFDPQRQSKTMRAHAVTPLILQGMLFVPESNRPDRKGLPRNWVEPMLEQACSFSGEGSIPYDDGLDQMVQAMLYLSQRGTFHVEPQRLAQPDPDEADERKLREAEREQARTKVRENPYGI